VFSVKKSRNTYYFISSLQNIISKHTDYTQWPSRAECTFTIVEVYQRNKWNKQNMQYAIKHNTNCIDFVKRNKVMNGLLTSVIFYISVCDKEYIIYVIGISYVFKMLFCLRKIYYSMTKYYGLHIMEPHAYNITNVQIIVLMALHTLYYDCSYYRLVSNRKTTKSDPIIPLLL